jgi:hypothetical protein
VEDAAWAATDQIFRIGWNLGFKLEGGEETLSDDPIATAATEKPPEEPPQGGTPSKVISIETGFKASARRFGNSAVAMVAVLAVSAVLLVTRFCGGTLAQCMGFVMLLAVALGATYRLAQATAKATDAKAHATN